MNISLRRALILCSIFCFSAVSAAHQQNDTMPACGLQCMMSIVPSSNCTLTNTSCICADAPLLDEITACVRESCSIRDKISTQRYQKHECNVPSHNRSLSTGLLGLFGGIIATVAFLVRIYARVDGVAGRFGPDDYILGVAMIENIPFTVISKALTRVGLGQDVWELPFNNLTTIQHMYFYSEIMYFSIFPLIRISLLFFYLRIFPHKNFRRQVNVLIAANIIYGMLFVIMTICQCLPVYGAWTRWDGTFEGKCLDVNLFGWISGALNVFLHLTVICLPIQEVFKLVLSKTQKIQILAMFSVGLIFTMAISVVRLQNLVAFAQTHNFSQDYAALGYWTTIEVHSAIICCCVPAFRSLLRKWFPSLFTGSEAHKSHQSKCQTTRISIAQSPGLPKEMSRPKYDDDNRSFVPLVDIESRGLPPSGLKDIEESTETLESTETFESMETYEMKDETQIDVAEIPKGEKTKLPA